MEGIYAFPGLYTFLLIVGLMTVMKVYNVGNGFSKDDIGDYSIIGNRRIQKDKGSAINKVDLRLSKWVLIVTVTSPKILYNKETNILGGAIMAVHVTTIIMFIKTYWSTLFIPFFQQIKRYVIYGIPRELYLKDLILINILPCILKDVHNLIKNIQIYNFHIGLGPMVLVWTHAMIILIRGRQYIARYKYSKSRRHLLGLVKCLVDFLSLIGSHGLIAMNNIWLSKVSTILSIGWDIAVFYRSNLRLRIVALILTYCHVRKLISMNSIISKTIYGSECMSHYDIVKTIVWFIGRIELIIVRKKEH